MEEKRETVSGEVPPEIEKYFDQAARRATKPTIEECEDYGSRHGPDGWRASMPPEQIKQKIESGDAQPAVVLAGDIRRSTLVMKEALFPKHYAETMGAWIAMLRVILRENDGWFGTFTGDGFLAYWPVDTDHEEVAVRDAQRVLPAAFALLSTFEFFQQRWRDNSKNFPANVGLALGIDAGPAYLTVVDDDLTIIGAPVVGAFRMMQSARPQEIIANVQFRHLLDDYPQIEERAQVKTSKEARGTKEFPRGQDVFLIEQTPTGDSESSDEKVADDGLQVTALSDEYWLADFTLGALGHLGPGEGVAELAGLLKARIAGQRRFGTRETVTCSVLLSPEDARHMAENLLRMAKLVEQGT